MYAKVKVKTKKAKVNAGFTFALLNFDF